MPDGLARIAMKEYSRFPAQRADLPNRLQRAQFVVGVHHRNQNRIWPRFENLLELIELRNSIAADTDVSHLEPVVFQRRERMQSRIMLDLRGDDVATFFAQPV